MQNSLFHPNNSSFECIGLYIAKSIRSVITGNENVNIKNFVDIMYVFIVSITDVPMKLIKSVLAREIYRLR